jgi:hypothetical protein
MSKRRFRSLEIEMIRRGVALRHARRAALELECHHRELVEQALGRGNAAGEAERVAHEALGADAMIIERYANQMELRSWAHRWPAGYVLAPLVGFAGVFVAAVMVLIGLSTHLPALTHHGRLSAGLTHDMDVLVGVLLLWVLPVVVATGFGALAGLQHIAFRWLTAGIVILGIVAASMNVTFVLTGGAPSGFMRAGIGFDSGNLPHELLRALAMTSVMLIPAGWLRYWMTSRRTTVE